MTPTNINIQEFGLLELNEIENHPISGTLFCQYQTENNTGHEQTHSLRLDLVIENSEDLPDLRECSLTQIEEMLMQEAERVLRALPAPLRRIDARPH